MPGRAPTRPRLFISRSTRRARGSWAASFLRRLPYVYSAFALVAVVAAQGYHPLSGAVLAQVAGPQGRLRVRATAGAFVRAAEADDDPPPPTFRGRAGGGGHLTNRHTLDNQEVGVSPQPRCLPASSVNRRFAPPLS